MKKKNLNEYACGCDPCEEERQNPNPSFSPNFIITQCSKCLWRKRKSEEPCPNKQRLEEISVVRDERR